MYQKKEIAPEEAETYQKSGRKVRISGIITTSGIEYEFPKGKAARIVGDQINSTGSPVTKKTWMELEKANIQKIMRDRFLRALKVSTKDGDTYKVESKSFVI